ncbi:MAG: hypothetical protein LIP11_09590 [Clostridiales bacterium]|nr:hypothetical protein [Clostridiales bacterium]
MQVYNYFLDESICYTKEKPDISMREEDVANLVELAEYCGHELVNEKIRYQDDTLWEKSVEAEVSLADWLYGRKGKGSEDARRLFLEIIDKRFEPIEVDLPYPNAIYISLGEFENAVSNETEYIEKRREKLTQCQNPEEYEDFMKSCFINCIFAKGIVSEMKYIDDFPAHTEEITKNLGVLNDEAIDLYEKYCDNLKEAMNILSAKLLECSADPKHKEKLNFTFAYEEQVNGENQARTKRINCSPHLKLIRRDSNLRIYFWWCDSDVGKGEKVLVGRIGRHPY